MPDGFNSVAPIQDETSKAFSKAAAYLRTNLFRLKKQNKKLNLPSLT